MSTLSNVLDAGTVLLALAIILVLLPPKYDPAIRIKEWQIRRWRRRP